jgi:hypothetical protein
MILRIAAFASGACAANPSLIAFSVLARLILPAPFPSLFSIRHESAANARGRPAPHVVSDRPRAFE